jgi:hypothetical protein
MDIDDETRRRLWEERRIAVHYPHKSWNKAKLGAKDKSSTDPTDYEGAAKTAMKILAELARDGGYVCAQHYPKEEWLVGVVKPSSKIELFYGKWGNQNDLQGRTAILKTLRLTKFRLVKPGDYAVLSVGRPRQGTIRRWYRAGKAIENLVENRKTKPQLSDLSTAQQETLCSEYLRLPEVESVGLPRLTHLLLPPGRTMRDIDIIGLAASGKLLVAQVTFAALSNVGGKRDRLLTFRGPNTHLVLFCDCTQPQTQDGIMVFPLQKAYDAFASTPAGKLWLQRSALWLQRPA